MTTGKWLLAGALVLAACSSDDGGSDSASTATGDVVTTDEPAAEPTDAETPTEPDAAVTDPVETDPTGESVTEVSIEPSPYIGLAAGVSVTTEISTVVQLTATSSGVEPHTIETPATSAAATEHLVPLVGMRAERTYTIDVDVFDENGQQLLDTVAAGEFTTSALPERFADHTVDIIDPARVSPGYTIVEFDTLFIPEGSPSSQYLVAYDDEGEVAWYYENTGALAGVERTPAGTFNMFYWPFGIREVDVLGNVVGHWRPQPASSEGDEVVDELVVEGVDPDQVVFQGGIGALAGNPGDPDPLPVRAPWIDMAGVHHESWPMPNGNVLTLSTTIHELTPEQRSTFCPDDLSPFNAVSDVAVEFDPSGRVVRTWDLWDAIDIDEHPGVELCVPAGIFAEENTRDWNHANSVVYDPARDAVIVSSRHTNQIVAFDHLDDEGPQTEVRWILGEGATMPLDGEPTYYQHAVEVNPDGTIVVYDNGNVRPGTSPDDPANPQYSRAVIYDVDDSSDDPADWSASQMWEHVDTLANGEVVYTAFIGDADVLDNGNVLITHGGIGTFPPGSGDDPLHILIREVVPDGESGGDIVWELRSVEDPEHVTYRSERIDSFYFGPAWSPRLAPPA
jgi:hypothetical protein